MVHLIFLVLRHYNCRYKLVLTANVRQFFSSKYFLLFLTKPHNNANDLARQQVI